MFATAGSTRLLATQLIPEMMMELLLPPVQPNTRTGTRRTALATPWVEPPMVPATCVP